MSERHRHRLQRFNRSTNRHDPHPTKHVLEMCTAAGCSRPFWSDSLSSAGMRPNTSNPGHWQAPSALPPVSSGSWLLMLSGRSHTHPRSSVGMQLSSLGLPHRRNVVFGFWVVGKGAKLRTGKMLPLRSSGSPKTIARTRQEPDELSARV